MKMNKFLILFVLISNNLIAQNLKLTLDNAISLSHMSKSYQIVQIDSLINEYNYELFRITRLPTLNMSGSFPISNSISIVTQPDGSDKFLNRFNSTSSAGLSLSQLLPFTGGSISVSSSLNRLDNFEPNRNTSYGFNALNISYSQRISRYNEYKWNVKLNDLKRQINYIQHYQSIEVINQQVVELFFNLVVEQRKVDLNRSILEFSEYVYEKAKAWFAEKRISEEDYLDAKIEYYKALDNVNNVYIEEMKERLKKFLDIPEQTQIVADFNFDILSTYHFNFDFNQIIENALYYNGQLNNNYTNLLFDQKAQQLKLASRPTLSVSLGGGFNSQADYIRYITNNMNRQMSASVSLSFTILDWGHNKIQRRILEQEIKKIDLHNAEIESQALSRYKRELKYVSHAIRNIARSQELINLLDRRIELLKINVEHGRIDIQNFVQAKTQMIRTEMSYIYEIRDLYMTIYKYRYLSLIDIRDNTVIVHR